MSKSQLTRLLQFFHNNPQCDKLGFYSENLSNQEVRAIHDLMEIRYGILSPKVTFGGLVPPDVCFYGWKTENGTRVKVRPIQYLELLISCYDRLSAVIQDKLEQNIQEVLDLIEGVLQNEINIGSESLN